MFNKHRNNDIKAQKAYDLININRSNTEFIILDVRTPEEYSESHINNAENIDYKSSTFIEELEKMDKNIKYLVYCRSGRRSSNAVRVMIKLGFTDLHNLSGGIGKWKKENLPLV